MPAGTQTGVQIARERLGDQPAGEAHDELGFERRWPVFRVG